MADPSNWGMAKSIFASVPDELDLTDDAAVERFVAGFNAVPREDRQRLVPGPGCVAPGPAARTAGAGG